MTPVVARLCAGQRRISLKAKSFTLAPLRYITPRNAHPFCNLPLRQRCGQAEPVPQADDLALAGGKTMGERVVHGIVAVVLIDGERLVQMMMDHDLGVYTRKTFRVKEIDSDYFDGDL